jgi:hypothetical protein
MTDKQSQKRGAGSRLGLLTNADRALAPLANTNVALIWQ